MPIEKINSIKNSYIANSRNINLTAPQKFKRNEETFNAKRKEEQDALDAKEAKLQDLLKNL